MTHCKENNYTCFFTINPLPHALWEEWWGQHNGEYRGGNNNNNQLIIKETGVGNAVTINCPPVFVWDALNDGVQIKTNIDNIKSNADGFRLSWRVRQHKFKMETYLMKKFENSELEHRLTVQHYFQDN